MLFAALAILVGVALVTNHIAIDKDITDVSWPNCSYRPTQLFQAGIVGVTDGLDFRPNPCLVKETTWFEHYALYMNTGYPGETYGKKYLSTPLSCAKSYQQSQCLAYNYGYNAAVYAIQYASIRGVHASIWWLDVETDNSWTTSDSVNQAVLVGAVDAISQQIPFSTVGFYSDSYQWNTIVGTSWQNELPVWLGTGSVTASAAREACSESGFTGGSVWLSQYTQGLDKNVTCSSQLMHYVSLIP